MTDLAPPQPKTNVPDARFYLDPAQVNAALYAKHGQTFGTFGDLQVTSHFQPVFSLAHQRVIGYEALLRGYGPNGNAYAPAEVFYAASGMPETVFLDRLCRAVHMRNFMHQHADDTTWLFLNVTPQVLANIQRGNSFLQAQLEKLRLPPHRVVIEILESALENEHKLTDAVNYYRDLGCLIAIDDFGAGHSNFDRICRLRPDIVKFDRSIAQQAAVTQSIRSIVPGMVSLLHEAGSLVVMEGIETETEAMIAMDADADFVQGYYFALPAPQAVSDNAKVDSLRKLFDQFKRVAAIDRSSYRSEIAPYLNGLGYASVLLKAGQPFEVSCKPFLELPRSERCFLLDANGLQIGNNANAPHLQIAVNPRFAPLNDASGANWSRRHYFRRALNQTEKVHVTRPYLSIASATPCVTASIAFKMNGETRVLCGDITWDDKSLALERTFDSSAR